MWKTDLRKKMDVGRPAVRKAMTISQTGMMAVQARMKAVVTQKDSRLI